jgi:hypothetical protein
VITLTKAISLLGKRIWTVWVPSNRYGCVRSGVILHVTIHAEKINRGEWHAYVSTKSGGSEYSANDLYLTKAEADTEKERRLKGGDTP